MITPAKPPPPWQPGHILRWALVEACPACGGTIFGATRTIGRYVRYKQCKACDRSQKRVGDMNASKANLVALPSASDVYRFGQIHRP